MNPAAPAQDTAQAPGEKVGPIKSVTTFRVSTPPPVDTKNFVENPRPAYQDPRPLLRYLLAEEHYAMLDRRDLRRPLDQLVTLHRVLSRLGDTTGAKRVGMVLDLFPRFFDQGGRHG
jgi:hypothetical protein